MRIDVEVDLNEWPVEGVIRKLKARYIKEFPKAKRPGIYSDFDWARIAYAFNLLEKDTRVLEVGFGAGQLLNAMALSGEFESVSGVDVKYHSKFIQIADSLDITTESVDQLSFDEGRFDCVVCMEVLEHVEKEVFLGGLDQLRRVCRNQLIMSVPFNEPLPLPSYHKLQFTENDVDEYFPEARRHLLKKRGTHWLLLEERLN